MKRSNHLQQGRLELIIIGRCQALGLRVELDPIYVRVTRTRSEISGQVCAARPLNRRNTEEIFNCITQQRHIIFIIKIP
jgi:hypothetical protein